MILIRIQLPPSDQAGREVRCPPLFYRCRFTTVTSAAESALTGAWLCSKVFPVWIVLGVARRAGLGFAPTLLSNAEAEDPKQQVSAHHEGRGIRSRRQAGRDGSSAGCQSRLRMPATAKASLQAAQCCCLR